MTAAFKKTPRHSMMVANFRHRPFFEKEAALLKELALGKQWRIDAMVEAIEYKNDWNKIDSALVLRQAAMFGRTSAAQRICESLADQVSRYALDGALRTAMLHGHYKTGDVFKAFGAAITQENAGSFAYALIGTDDRRKMDYAFKSGLDPKFMIERAVREGDAAAARHARKKLDQLGL